MSKTSSTNYSGIQPHSSESEQSLSMRPFNVIEPEVAKRICFYKSGDPQFNGVKMVVNSRSFKSFDTLLDNLSKRIPLPFGVRNITTPRGIHSIDNVEDLEDGKSYICSQQKKIKPVNLEMARKKPLPWKISRPISAHRRAIQLARRSEGGQFQSGSTIWLSNPKKKLLVFKNGNVKIRCTVVLSKKNIQSFEAFLDHVSELMQYPVLKLYTPDGRKVSNLQALHLCSGAIVAAGREPFKAGNYDPHRYSLPGKLPGVSNHVYPRGNAKSEGRKASGIQINSSSRSLIFPASSHKNSRNDNNADSSIIRDNGMGLVHNRLGTDGDLSVVPSANDIEKSIHLNQDGTMTVEMRVRFKIKKEETLKWTTAVSHAGTSAVITADQVSEFDILTFKNSTGKVDNPKDDVLSQQISTEIGTQKAINQLDSSTYDIWQNPVMNTELKQARNNVKPSFHRPSTPWPQRVRQKKALVESVTVVSDTAVSKKMAEQFAINDKMGNSNKSNPEHCMITHIRSQITSETNPQTTEKYSNYSLTKSQTGQQKKEFLNKETVKMSSDLPEKGGSLLNALEKSGVEKRLSNSLTSECGSSTGQGKSSPRKTSASGQYSPNKCDVIGQEPKSIHNHLEWFQSKSEKMIRDNFQTPPCSSSSSPKNTNTVYEDVQIPPAVTETDCIGATCLPAESQALPFSSKKKMLKKKMNQSFIGIMNENVGFQQDLYDIPIEGNTENKVKTYSIHRTRDTTKHSSTQLAVYKRELTFPKSEGSNNIVNTKEDLYSQVLIKPQENDLELNIKKNLNRQLFNQKSKSNKKYNSSSVKPDESKRIKKGTCKALNETEQSICSALLKPLTDTGNGFEAEDEKGKNISKHKKAKRNKKPGRVTDRKGKELDATKMFDTLGQAVFIDEITEHSLENYVQRWLLNVFPNTTKPKNNLLPINSIDRPRHHLSTKTFPYRGSKETGKSKMIKGIQPKTTLNYLNEVENLEESAKELYRCHPNCLGDVDNSLIHEGKYLLLSDSLDKANLSTCDITCEKNKNQLPKYNSETDIQADPKAILATTVQKDCLSGLLLHELKSVISNFEKNKTEILKLLYSIPDIFSSSLLGSSSNLLLVWLILNLNKSLFNINEDNLAKPSCSCSELFRLLQYLKQVATKEEDKDLIAAVSNVQDFMEKCLEMHIKNHNPTYFQENDSLRETKNISEHGKLIKNLTPNAILNSEEVLDAKKWAEELKSNYEEKKICSWPVENSDIHDLDILQNLNCIKEPSKNLVVDKEFSKENEAISVEKSEVKIMGLSFNHEEFVISEEPNPAVYNIKNIHTQCKIIGLETSELEDKELKSLEKQEYFWKKKKICENPTSGENDSQVKNTLKENLEDDTCVETSGQLSPVSPLSLLYESKQMLVNTEDKISRVKLIIKELEYGVQPNSPAELKKIFKSPTTSDSSNYQSEVDESDCRSRPSSDLRTRSTDDATYKKVCKKGYVKKTIEQLNGKTEAYFKPIFNAGPPYSAQMLQKDTEPSLHLVMNEDPFFDQAHNACPNGKVVSSLISDDAHDLNTNNTWKNENALLPTPQFNLNEEESYNNNDCSGSNQIQDSHFKAVAENEGTLIEKGKWLLKENHLIRRSLPDNSELNGNADTTSADTFFDNDSSDVPYFPSGNLSLQSSLKEIFSSEGMAKDCGNGGNYFNSVHPCNDSVLFSDVPSIKSNIGKHNGALPFEPTGQGYNSSLELCTALENSSSSFTTVEFRLSNNKIHPIDQTSDDIQIQTQPTRNDNSSRNNHDGQDSLDKLHAICGQHCPILTAIINPVNEQSRGCVYQKASDIENQLQSSFLKDTLYSIWQGGCTFEHGRPHTQIKTSCIHKMINKVFGRSFGDNIKYIINCNNFKFPLPLNKTQGVMKLNVTENMTVNPVSGRIIMKYKNNLSSDQGIRCNVSQSIRRNRVCLFLYVDESGKSEIHYYHKSFINTAHLKVTVSMKDGIALSLHLLLLILKQKQSTNNISFLVFISVPTFFP